MWFNGIPLDECYLTLWLVKYLPAWFPGARFVKISQTYKSRAQAFSLDDILFFGSRVDRIVSKKIGQERRHKATVTYLLLGGTEEEDIIKWSAGSLYAGGADTVREKPDLRALCSAQSDRYLSPAW
jgi:hypothetical protein